MFESVGSGRLIPVARDTETSVREEQVGAYRCRYAYARSADTRRLGEAGQDVVLLRHDEARVTFTLCDGVSESFQGEIAAESLGAELLDWLWAIAPVTVDPTTLRASLAVSLRRLTLKVTPKVSAYPIPRELPALLREVLDQRRANGSETMLVGARVDRPSPELARGRVVLIWLGDSRLRFWGPDGERTSELGETIHSDQRWSSRAGSLHADPHVALFPLVDGPRYLINRLVAYSDGLASLDHLSDLPPSPGLQQLIDQTAVSPASDDVSIVELLLEDGRPAMAGLGIAGGAA
jgi:hypothetical protein